MGDGDRPAVGAGVVTHAPHAQTRHEGVALARVGAVAVLENRLQIDQRNAARRGADRDDAGRVVALGGDAAGIGDGDIGMAGGPVTADGALGTEVIRPAKGSRAAHAEGDKPRRGQALGVDGGRIGHLHRAATGL